MHRRAILEEGYKHQVASTSPSLGSTYESFEPAKGIAKQGWSLRFLRLASGFELGQKQNLFNNSVVYATGSLRQNGT